MPTPLFSELLSDLPRAASVPADARQRFGHLLAAALAAGQLRQLMLSGYHGDEQDLQRIVAQPVQVKGATRLSLVYRYRMRDVTRNLLPADVPAQVGELLDSGFRNAHLHTASQTVQLTISKKGRAHLHVSAVRSEPDAASRSTDRAHNRAKHREVDLAQAHWTGLSLATPDHALVPAMARKWKQINKFVEIFGAALQRSPLWARPLNQPLRVADFGAGKGYLTFAMAEYLQTHGRAAQVMGIELRPDLVALCNGVATDHGPAGLSFVQGDVRSFEPGSLDVMVALHACDTATDHALHLGLRAGASLILCAPCCHKEVRPQMEAADLPRTLRPLLQHGIHLGQEAEMVTDSLRALLLEAAGYDTQVFEFVSLEHTAKNKMILAVKRPTPLPQARLAELQQQIDALKTFYGLRQQTLETLLAAA